MLEVVGSVCMLSSPLLAYSFLYISHSINRSIHLLPASFACQPCSIAHHTEIASHELPRVIASTAGPQHHLARAVQILIQKARLKQFRG